MDSTLQAIKKLIDTNKLTKSVDYKFDSKKAILYIRNNRLFAELHHKDCEDADGWFAQLKQTPSFLGCCRIATFSNLNGTKYQSPAIMLNAEFLSGTSSQK